MKNIIIITNGPVLGFTPFMKKVSNYFNAANVGVEVWTQQRIDDFSRVDRLSNEHMTLVSRWGKRRSNRIVKGLGLLYFTARVFVKAISKRSSNTVFVCSRFESTFPIYLASLFTSVQYIYLDRDAPHLTYRFSDWILKCLYGLEKKVSKRSLVHVVPGDSRNVFGNRNVHVLPNLPDRKSLEMSVELVHEFESKIRLAAKGRFVLFCSGWLVESRGRKLLIEFLRDKKVCSKAFFVFAGDADEEMKNLIIKSDSALWLGRIPFEEALAVTRLSDFVVGFYDPSYEINKRAEPNKFWDALVLKKAVITNNGIDTLEFFRKFGRFYMSDYKSFDMLSILRDVKDLKKQGSLKNGIENSWEDAFTEILKRASIH
ncbi:hypothetical protein [Pseudidiomarina insulisalsae]|uniref:Glycosyl transferase family 1 domain-containing protein n=1 Tax=Pseudidiomarina insulisalsae TaxID=575789 RepID=A0A432YNR6_9GAMM|nr:hypothetical protein [Pseudidiomarina insulisalsae]RUO62641.1 hypothetical protein CWI71_04205 [Pseudidiomarina insulisalsae]